MSKSNPINVGIKKGTFYLSQDADGGEGWTRQEFQNPQTGEKMVKYHKNVSIQGELTYVGLKDDKFKGKSMSILVKGEGETYSLVIPILDTKGVKATNQYFNSLVGVLDGLSKGSYVNMFVNNKNKDKSDNLYKNIVVLDKDNKLIKSTFGFDEVPKWESKEEVDDFGAKTVVYSPKPSNTFYIAKFNEVVEKFKSNKEEAAPEETKTAKVEEIEEEDLPF